MGKHGRGVAGTSDTFWYHRRVIYLFHGTDIEKVRAKAFAWVAAARAKEPNLAYARLAREELSDSALENAALSGGLFVKRLLVLIDDPFAKSDDENDSAGALETHWDTLAKSDNAIVIVAPKLAAAAVKRLEKRATKAYAFDKAAGKSVGRGFNTALVSALAAKNREGLWLEVMRALRAGDAPEMLHGLLHWKARDLMEKGARAWAPREARALSLGLIALLMDTRRKGLELSTELERWALQL